MFKEITGEDIRNSTPEVTPVLELKRNTKQHCIIFNSDGNVQRCLDPCHCDECVLDGNLDRCRRIHNDGEKKEDEKEAEYGDDYDNEDDVIGDDSDEHHAKIEWGEVVSEGNVIALRTPSNVKECFYLSCN